jgi:hypothetical protein
MEMEESVYHKTDPFDLDALRIDTTPVEGLGVEKLLTRVPTCRPGKQVWFRVHPGAEYRANVGLIKLDETDEWFLLTPAMAAEMPGEYRAYTLFLYVNKSGDAFLWPIPRPGDDGNWNSWHQSAQEMAELAMSHWIRISSNKNVGGYVPAVAKLDTTEPVWPKQSLKELFMISFKGKLIDTPEHPIVKKLRGIG